MQKFTIPEGWTLEQLEEYGRQKRNERRRADYARHAERNMRQRIQAAKNLLSKHGFLTIPQPPALPWDACQRPLILMAVEKALEDQNG